MVREKYDWNISGLGINIKTKGKKSKPKIEWRKAKLKRLRSTCKEYISRANKILNMLLNVRSKKNKKTVPVNQQNVVN